MASRRAIVLAFSGVVGAAAWRFRIPQVSAFMIAAGLRKRLLSSNTPDFRTLAPEWRNLQALQSPSTSHSRGLITYHPWYDNFNASIANRCLAETAELGAHYARIDVRWQDLIPDGQNVNEAAWTWYQHYLVAARSWYGLEPLIVLSNPPNCVQHLPIRARLSAWATYVETIARRTGELCKIFQVLNEPNNPVYRFFPNQIGRASCR